MRTDFAHPINAPLGPARKKLSPDCSTATSNSSTTTVDVIAFAVAAGAGEVGGATDIATIKRAQNYFPPRGGK